MEGCFTFQWRGLLFRWGGFILKWGVCPMDLASVLMGCLKKNSRVKWGPPPSHPSPPQYGKPCSKLSLLFSCRVKNLTSDCCHVNNLYKVFFLIFSRYLIELLQMPWIFRGDIKFLSNHWQSLRLSICLSPVPRWKRQKVTSSIQRGWWLEVWGK